MTYGPQDLRRDLGVSHETCERLETHRRLLAAWSKRINLIGPGELDQYWKRHALDSAQLVQHAGGAVRWVDLGSGAGFPGLVVACCLADVPGAAVTLVESNNKKAAFLREAIRETGAPATVFAGRAEALGAAYPPPRAGEVDAAQRRTEGETEAPIQLGETDSPPPARAPRESSSPAGGGGLAPPKEQTQLPSQVVCARAFAPLWRIIEYAKPHLDRGAIGLFPKGAEAAAELAEAAEHWLLRAETLPSMSDPRARIVRVEGAERVHP